MDKIDLKPFKIVMEATPVKRPIFKNTLFAFLIGGIIGIIAEVLIVIFKDFFNIDEKIANSLMSMVIVVTTSVLTGFGLFDKIGQYAGAGTYIPITGFANSMTSAAIEGRSEGLVLGIMSNMFKLAGAVIVAGVVSAFISGTIIYFMEQVIWKK